MSDYPFGISGCFRLRNESQFMETVILSHLPYLDEAVLVVQPSDDDTVERAERLASEHPNKIKFRYYGYKVDWIDTPGFYEKDPDEPGHLVHLSNWALKQCSYSWIAKIEGDVICLTTFANVVKRVYDEPDLKHYYGRVILNVAGSLCNQISMSHPRNAGWDIGVFPNDPKYKFTRSGKFEQIYIGPDRTCMGWSGLHMKRCKVQNLRIQENEPWAPFSRVTMEEALREFNRKMEYVGIDDPLGEDCLYEKLWINHYLQGETCPIPA